MNTSEIAHYVEQALDTCGDIVYRVAVSQLRSPHDAQDVTQDAFLRLMEHVKAHGALTSPEHLQAWLIRVTVNRCRDLHRTAWNRRVEHDGAAAEDGRPSRIEALPDPAEAPEDTAIRHLCAHPIWQLMEFLPHDQRVIVHLRYVEEMSEARIAQVLDINRITVRTRLHRARKRLQTLMRSHAAAQQREPAHGGRQNGMPGSHDRPRTIGGGDIHDRDAVL